MIDHASLSKRGGRRYGSLGQGAALWVRGFGTSATVAAVTTVFTLLARVSNVWTLSAATSTSVSVSAAVSNTWTLKGSD